MHMKLILVVLAISLMIPSVAISGGAAPYTKEAIDEIKAAQQNIEQPKYNKQDSRKERTRKFIEYYRAFFSKAGYDFDDTINKVVNDMRNQPDILSRTNADESVFGIIYVTLNMMMSDCKYYNIDCLGFFDSKTAESVRWLSENTEFSF